MANRSRNDSQSGRSFRTGRGNVSQYGSRRESSDYTRETGRNYEGYNGDDSRGSQFQNSYREEPQSYQGRGQGSGQPYGGAYHDEYLPRRSSQSDQYMNDWNEHYNSPRERGYSDNSYSEGRNSQDRGGRHSQAMDSRREYGYESTDRFGQRPSRGYNQHPYSNEEETRRSSRRLGQSDRQHASQPWYEDEDMQSEEYDNRSYHTRSHQYGDDFDVYGEEDSRQEQQRRGSYRSPSSYR